MLEFLQIVILCRDRVEYLQESIDSALTQNESELDYEIIISDNSEKDDVNELINKHYLENKKIKYIRRSPPFKFNYDHFSLVVSELNTKYVVLFHDDDILHPDYIQKISPFILNNSNAAVGCNAIIFKNEITNSEQKMHNFKAIKKFNNKKYFLQQYLLGNGGIAPLPGYIYKTDFLKKISNSIGLAGKHSDAVLLATLLDYGSITWLPNVLMYYRVHGKRDSSTESVPNRLTLLRYMFSEGVDRSSTPIFLYRYLFWFNWLRQQGSFFANISKWKYRIVAKFLVLRSFKVIFTSYFWLLILKKINKLLRL